MVSAKLKQHRVREPCSRGEQGSCTPPREAFSTRDSRNVHALLVRATCAVCGRRGRGYGKKWQRKPAASLRWTVFALHDKKRQHPADRITSIDPQQKTPFPQIYKQRTPGTYIHVFQPRQSHLVDWRTVAWSLTQAAWLGNNGKRKNASETSTCVSPRQKLYTPRPRK